VSSDLGHAVVKPIAGLSNAAIARNLSETSANSFASVGRPSARARRTTSVGCARSATALCASANAALPTTGTSLRIARATSFSETPAAMKTRYARCHAGSGRVPSISAGVNSDTVMLQNLPVHRARSRRILQPPGRGRLPAWRIERQRRREMLKYKIRPLDNRRTYG